MRLSSVTSGKFSLNGWNLPAVAENEIQIQQDLQIVTAVMAWQVRETNKDTRKGSIRIV